MTTPFGDLLRPPSPFIARPPYLVMRQLARRAGERAASATTVAIMMSERQHVGRGVEEVVALRDADRLQRRAERAGAAEEERRAEAGERVPAREDDERDRHQALAGRDALVPAARIVERQIGAADAGERRRRPRSPAGARSRRCSPWRAPRRRCRRRCARRGRCGCCANAHQRKHRKRRADEEEHVDLERRLRPAGRRTSRRAGSPAGRARPAGCTACRRRRRGPCRTASARCRRRCR